jgi:predicted metalloprotease
MAYAELDRPADAVTVSSRDVAASNAKVAAAYGALMTMWTAHFDELGTSFEKPALLRYRGSVRTNCGVMPQDNAVYCPPVNAVYFDEIFVAKVAKTVGQQLGTDGDMAAVGVIAHEVGHAVAIQLGYESRFTYANEAAADCLAGAFAKSAQADGSLEEGDLEEAYIGMAMAGDAEPELTGDRRMDNRILQRAALMGHGTREQRMQNFETGLAKGPKGCLPAFG